LLPSGPGLTVTGHAPPVIGLSAVNDRLLTEIAADYGTPAYVYDLDAIRDRASRLRSLFPDADLLYAVKANSNGAVLRELAGLGLGAEVITLGELERAQRAGVPPRLLLVGGPGQDDQLIGRAIELGAARVSLDSASQWELWRGRVEGRNELPRFLVRINPQLDPRTHPHLATGAAESKFGLPPAEGLELAAELAERALFAGFHFHVGSQIRSLDVYGELRTVVEKLYSARPEGDTLDLGGGFAVPDFPLEEFASFARRLASDLHVRLLLEPGRFLVAEAGVLLTRVRHVKRGPIRHVIADAGMADLLRPALYGAEHPVRRVGESPCAVVGGVRAGVAAGTAADIDGPLCENADRLATRARLPDDVRAGDLLAVEQAGAYGMAMASNYASSLRPAEVAVSGGASRLVRSRESVEDLLRLEIDAPV
jgi:diaminopimelate decarboxylase